MFFCNKLCQFTTPKIVSISIWSSVDQSVKLLQGKHEILEYRNININIIKKLRLYQILATNTAKKLK